jgi:hypothetical protein
MYFAPCFFAVLFGMAAFTVTAASSDEMSLNLPFQGSTRLRIITPSWLELTLVTTKRSLASPVEQWDFVNSGGELALPEPVDFTVTTAGKTISVARVGFKRRVLYAPLKKRDLRIGNYLYLQLSEPVPENQIVEVVPKGKAAVSSRRFIAKAEPHRFSPAIHVNQVGYIPGLSKKAMIGYFLGSLGELELKASSGAVQSPMSETRFKIIEMQSGTEVFTGTLKPRADIGFPSPAYKQVLEADFSEFKTAGEYQLLVPGLGVSFPFLIDEGVSGSFARTYALGIYHQRCGTGNEAPFTRFAHNPCHTVPAQIPDMSRTFEHANHELEKETENYQENPRHAAPRLKNIGASLYPFVKGGVVDVSGGHHDAGDYSKYTINSASFIHALIFGVDVFPGVRDLDNLGLPESGDGKSDILQEAKWEADFLAKMQDADGGFYFLVYPRDRTYEDNVTPDRGDPQVVFPKTTSATAAATAALAQCASSPAFKKQFPDAAAAYLEKAKKGWVFLQNAITRFGKDGAYQKITHYGDEFMHDDELAWAACEVFLATGNEEIHKILLQWLNPSDPATRKWGWLRLFDAYGAAIRSYAFAAKSGRIPRLKLDPQLLEQCENEIIAVGEEQSKRAEQSAYGTSFPEETKRARSAGWYFSGDAAFDLAVACQIDFPARNDPRPRMLEALLSNLNYEQGCNPVNIDYLTGQGWGRQREIVHQYAQNDRRTLPPTGIPLGNIQGGFGWLDLYKKELNELTFPSDGAPNASYPFYDRWADSFNLCQEFVIPNQARSLAYLSWLMAQSSIKTQVWTSAVSQIAVQASGSNTYTATLSVPGFDLRSARTVWEAANHQPAISKTFNVYPSKLGVIWVEVECQLPDGRRLFATTNLSMPK